MIAERRRIACAHAFEGVASAGTTKEILVEQMGVEPTTSALRMRLAYAHKSLSRLAFPQNSRWRRQVLLAGSSASGRF